MDIFKGTRPLDHVLAVVMVALAALIGFENASPSLDPELAHSLDSTSVLMAPVFAIAALPILWRRRNIVAAIGVSFAITAASLVMFGWVTRCGWALPLSLAMAYAVARFAKNGQDHVVGLVGVLALQVAALVMDAATGGLGPLVVTAPAAALCYGLGRLVQSRADRRRSVGPRQPVGHVPAS